MNLWLPGGQMSVKDEHVHIAVFKMDNQQGLTVKYMDFCSIYVAAWMGEEFGEEWIHVYVDWISSLFTWKYHNIVNQ